MRWPLASVTLAVGILVAEQDVPVGYPKTSMGALIAALFVVLTAGGWLLRHVFTVTIPAMQTTHESSVMAIGAAHKEAMLASSLANKEAVLALGTQHKKSLRQILEHHEKQCERRQQIEEAEVRAIVKALQDQGEFLERQGQLLDRHAQLLDRQGQVLERITVILEEMRRPKRQSHHPPPSAPL